MMLYAVILFCSLGVAPQNCDEVSSSHYERVPEGHALPFQCFKQAQAWAAEHGLVPGEGEYAKVRCSHHEFGSRVG